MTLIQMLNLSPLFFQSLVFNHVYKILNLQNFIPKFCKGVILALNAYREVHTQIEKNVCQESPNAT